MVHIKQSARGSRIKKDPVNPQKIPGICTAVIGFLLILTGVMLLGIGSAESFKEQGDVALKVMGPLCLTIGIILVIAGFLYKYITNRRLKQKRMYLKRSQSTSSLQTSILGSARTLSIEFPVSNLFTVTPGGGSNETSPREQNGNYKLEHATSNALPFDGIEEIICAEEYAQKPASARLPASAKRPSSAKRPASAGKQEGKRTLGSAGSNRKRNGSAGKQRKRTRSAEGRLSSARKALAKSKNDLRNGGVGKSAPVAGTSREVMGSDGVISTIHVHEDTHSADDGNVEDADGVVYGNEGDIAEIEDLEEEKEMSGDDMQNIDEPDHIDETRNNDVAIRKLNGKSKSSKSSKKFEDSVGDDLDSSLKSNLGE